MMLTFPHVDEIPLLVKLVSPGEQMFLLFTMESPGLAAIRPRGVVFSPAITRYKRA